MALKYLCIHTIVHDGVLAIADLSIQDLTSYYIMLSGIPILRTCGYMLPFELESSIML